MNLRESNEVFDLSWTPWFWGDFCPPVPMSWGNWLYLTASFPASWPALNALRSFLVLRTQWLFAFSDGLYPSKERPSGPTFTSLNSSWSQGSGDWYHREPMNKWVQLLSPPIQKGLEWGHRAFLLGQRIMFQHMLLWNRVQGQNGPAKIHLEGTIFEISNPPLPVLLPEQFLGGLNIRWSLLVFRDHVI